MGKKVTLYELFQANVLLDEKLLKIGKKPMLKNIFIVEEQNKVQVHYGDGGWLFAEYDMCAGTHCA